MTIKKKVFVSVAVLGLITICNSLILFYYVNKFKNSLEENTNIRRPSLLAVSELKNIVTNSKNLSFIWRRIDVENQDKKDLQEIYKVLYPENKKLLLELSKSWNSKSDVDSLHKIFENYDIARKSQLELMQSLAKFEDYSSLEMDPMKSIEVEGYLEDINKRCSNVEVLARKILENQKKENQQNEEILQNNMITLILILTFSGALIILSVLMLAWILTKQVTNPLVRIKDIIINLSKGELHKSELQKSNDEIGQMVEAVDLLVNGLQETSNFAENIGKGNYNAEFTPLSSSDVLGNSLLEMRTNLRNVAEVELQRKWATEGVAKFAEILRSNTNVDELCVTIISNLVKYLGANQGGIFILNDEGTEKFLELKGCYAYDRLKFAQKTVYEGEGLVGQSWIEKDTLFLTDVPDDYINITSGLGLANPNCILIVPLLYNEAVSGVIEIASFKVFQPYEIEFLEKVAQSIASSLSTVTVNHKTAKLLHDSRMLTEQLKSQEEELRQNQEEMQATSEETERRLAEAQEIIAVLQDELSQYKAK